MKSFSKKLEEKPGATEVYSAVMTSSHHPPTDLPSVLVTDLTYKAGFGPVLLENINLDLPPGSRCLLCGANGAGECAKGLKSLRECAFMARTRGTGGDLGLLWTSYRVLLYFYALTLLLQHPSPR